jgi:hypothetical protein
MTQKIVITLKSKDFGRISFKLKSISSELKEKVGKEIQRIVKLGVKTAKEELQSMGAIDTKELINNVKGEISKDGLWGRIFVERTSNDHETFVEYGTGVVGASNSHPDNPWPYDIHNHGDKGWVYFNPVLKRFVTTRGMKSRPFWLRTRLAVEEEIGKL